MRTKYGHRSSWFWFAIIQLVGIGLYISAQVIGLALLLPGSAIAAFIPLHRLWFPYLWSRYRTDAWELSDFLYLPTVILVNLLLYWIVNRYMSARRQQDDFEVRDNPTH